MDEAGDVGELAVRNPLDLGVLLYDGEELVGAKQNRILNLSVLLAAGSTTRIPVSCVEHGRWSSGGGRFRSAGHVAGPELRRHKAASLSTNALARGAAQRTVWASVDEQLARHLVASPTAANSDGFAARAARDPRPLAARSRSSRARTACSSRSPARAGAWTRCRGRPCSSGSYPKLLAGYVYDAFDPSGEVTSAEAVLEQLARCKKRQTPSVALGEDVRFEGKGVIGSGLAVDGELVQLSAYGDGLSRAQAL